MKVLYLPVEGIRFERDCFGVSKPIIPRDVFPYNLRGFILQDDDSTFFALGLRIICGNLFVVHSEHEYTVFLDCNKSYFKGATLVHKDEKMLRGDIDEPIPDDAYRPCSLFKLASIEDYYFTTVIDLIAWLGQAVLSAFKADGECYYFDQDTYAKATREYLFIRGL